MCAIQPKVTGGLSGEEITWNSRSPSNIEEVKALRDEALKGICVYCGHIEQYESLEQKAGEVDG